MDDRSRSGPASDFFVHLNCLSDSELYNNKSSSFTNTMNPPILLPFHTPYEVALSNIYFKKDFYRILANTEESAIQIVFYVFTIRSSAEVSAYTNEKVGPENLQIIDQKTFDKVYPSINLKSDTKSIINEYNKQFRYPLLQYDELNMEISYNLTRQHMYDLLKKIEGTGSDWFQLNLKDNKYGLYALKFGRKIANYLGYYPDKPLFLRFEGQRIDEDCPVVLEKDT